MKGRPRISLVVPLYNEEAVLRETYSRLTSVMMKEGLNYELLMVDDGSRDETLELARKLAHTDNRLKIISFSRNFGHQIAISAGMDKAAGDAVVIIDGDLQDPPEVILTMIEKWKEGYQVVYGVRTRREGEGFLKRFTAAIFYRLLRVMTSVDIPVDTGDFRLMDKKVVEQLKRMSEKSRFIRGMVSWVGFRQCKVEYIRKERFAGETKYPLRKMITFALDGILSFSHAPLRLASAFGFLCSGISFLLILYGFIIRYLFPENAVSGWASTFVAILFVGGVQLICLGILGEYLGRIYEEIKGRPLYIVAEEINFD